MDTTSSLHVINLLKIEKKYFSIPHKQILVIYLPLTVTVAAYVTFKVTVNNITVTATTTLSLQMSQLHLLLLLQPLSLLMPLIMM